MIKYYNEDCLIGLKKLDENLVDAIITDPPYGISFMNKKWDYDVPSVGIWEECLRVLKPGGHLLSFAGTKTQHRMCCRIEDAGFEIRDMLAWVYGSGFPKSLSIEKNTNEIYWKGWGTALKPAFEPITMARKPISEKTISKNCLKWNTGAINIDDCRIKTEDNLERVQGNNKDTSTPIAPNNGWISESQTSGRFPANFIHDGSEEVLEIFPETKSGSNCVRTKEGSFLEHGGLGKAGDVQTTYGDSGSASRFFYCAKASQSEKNLGCNEIKNNHPTVKPISLIEYLVKLVSRENSIVLDPFMGSGTTAIACIRNNRNFIGFELNKEYIDITECRINYELENRKYKLV